MRLLLFTLIGCMLACDLFRPATAPAPQTSSENGTVRSARPTRGATPASAVTASTPTSRPLATGLRVEPVADGLQLPANLTFAPDGRLFLTEVSLGTIRVIERGVLLSDPFATLDISKGGEQGLLGLALDPDFVHNRYVYLYYSQAKDKDKEAWRNRVVRMTDSGGRGTDMRVVLDHLPIGVRLQNDGHNGGRLGFGRDGRLYITVGDIGRTVIAQDKRKLAGKLLRINPDGTIPADNPFPGSPVFALGLRNSYGLGFHPLTGVPYVTDNGPEGHDEVNRIQSGGNYGSPQVNGVRMNPRFIDPIWESKAERGGIAGLTFYSGDLFPQYRNDLLFCMFTNGRLTRLRLAGASFEEVEAEELLSDQCNLDVTTGPEGAIYLSSISKVQRLVPAG